jgi:hypothetical protein
MSDKDREVPVDSPAVIAAKLQHANELRMWHLRQGRYADPAVPPPILRLPVRKASE